MYRRLEDSFGFFTKDFKLKVDRYIIEPADDHKDIVQEIIQLKHPDSFYYPIESNHKDDITDEPIGEILNTKRPAHLYQMPPTHIIYLEDGKPLPENFRQKESALIIHLLAVLYGARAQFDGWFFDTRLPLKQDGIATFGNKDLEKVLKMVVDTFSTWEKDAQKLFINILYSHSRCLAAYQWHWEQFLMEYIVTDTLWKLFTLTNKSIQSSRVSHRDRIGCMIENLGLFYEKNKINEIVHRRNDLFHEGLWDEEIPGFSGRGEPVRVMLNYLREINRRLILAIGGVTSTFVKSDWRSRSRCRLV